MGEITVQFEPKDLAEIKAHIDGRIAEVAAKAQGVDPRKVIEGAAAAIKVASAKHDLGPVQQAAIDAAVRGYLAGALGLTGED